MFSRGKAFILLNLVFFACNFYFCNPGLTQHAIPTPPNPNFRGPIYLPERSIEQTSGSSVLFLNHYSGIEDDGWDGFSNLANHLRNMGFSVAETYLNPITSSGLSGYDIVFYGGEYNRVISNSEATALRRFVENGGGLLLTGEHGFWNDYFRPCLNKVGNPWGITFEDDMVCDPTDHVDYPGDPDGGVDIPIIYPSSGHPAVANVDSFVLVWGGSLTASNLAGAIATTDNDAWLDTNAVWHGDLYHYECVYNPGEYQGVSSVMAVVEPQNGKVVAIGDFGLWWNDWFDDYDHRQLAESIFSYLGIIARGLDCNNAIVLTPGVPYNGSTAEGPSNVDAYSCVAWNESGPEVVHRIATNTDGDITATLSNVSVDLDVFILSDCDPESCVAYGGVSAHYSDAPAGTYYIVVDGFLGVSGSYTLTVETPYQQLSAYVNSTRAYQKKMNWLLKSIIISSCKKVKKYLKKSDLEFKVDYVHKSTASQFLDYLEQFQPYAVLVQAHGISGGGGTILFKKNSFVNSLSLEYSDVQVPGGAFYAAVCEGAMHDTLGNGFISCGYDAFIGYPVTVFTRRNAKFYRYFFKLATKPDRSVSSALAETKTWAMSKGWYDEASARIIGRGDVVYLGGKTTDGPREDKVDIEVLNMTMLINKWEDITSYQLTDAQDNAVQVAEDVAEVRKLREEYGADLITGMEEYSYFYRVYYKDRATGIFLYGVDVDKATGKVIFKGELD